MGLAAIVMACGSGYQAALINYGYIANAVLTTDEAVKAMEG